MNVGEKVTILNHDIEGKPIIEGEATLLNLVKHNEYAVFMGVDGKPYHLEQWRVKFADDGAVVNRWIYPQCDVDHIKQGSPVVIKGNT